MHKPHWTWRAARTAALLLAHLAAAVAAMSVTTASAATLRVPAEWPSIQAAISAASNGDTVLVAPGTYFENLDFLDKGLVLRSEAGAAQTVIDGQRLAPVIVIIAYSERASSVLGFTLRNGWSNSSVPVTGRGGGGVLAWFGSVTITDNVIENNWATQGGGIYVENALATIERNHIRNNLRPGNFGGSSGTGVHATGFRTVIRIAHNIIEGNKIQGQADGGAVSLFNTAHPTVIESNVIRNNSGATRGGAFAMVSQIQGRVRFANNLVTGNSAQYGGGLYVSMVNGGAGFDMVNNTVADNIASEAGSQMATYGFAASITAANNILYAASGTPPLYCDAIYSPLSPLFVFNLIHAAAGEAATGVCSAAPYLPENLRTDPGFGLAYERNRYELRPGSAAIDAGDNARAAGLGSDVAGRRRLVDGNHDGTATVDLGALEVQGQRQGR